MSSPPSSATIGPDLHDPITASADTLASFRLGSLHFTVALVREPTGSSEGFLNLRAVQSRPGTDPITWRLEWPLRLPLPTPPSPPTRESRSRWPARDPDPERRPISPDLHDPITASADTLASFRLGSLHFTVALVREPTGSSEGFLNLRAVQSRPGTDPITWRLEWPLRLPLPTPPSPPTRESRSRSPARGSVGQSG